MERDKFKPYGLAIIFALGFLGLSGAVYDWWTEPTPTSQAEAYVEAASRGDPDARRAVINWFKEHGYTEHDLRTEVERARRRQKMAARSK